ncbi:hypothetical protein [Psychromonas hadalis]|uniref:hypothetical protein n=1 Tax=Psychromonas hadalis TaxID=211669 RepID=UPI0003B36149|nr:hypothetical protein [Psychromonas hadalis]
MSVSLRKYPYPYQAMLAICSDLDETPNKEIYFETARYLNTTEETLLGKGVGLEVGNTIYFEMPEHNFSYTNTDDDGRKKIQKLIQSGHIDCLHSFGDFVNDRAKIEQYWSEIRQGERKIEVWVDHAQAPTNLDNDIMQGQGAESGKAPYHSDLTVKTGALPFIWKGRVTSCVAQNAKRSYRALFNKKQIKASLKTITLEFVKGWLARLGNQKYAMHQANKVLRKTQLIDGTPVLEFLRCNPSWGGVSMFDSARGIHQVLTKSVLDALVANAGCSIFYSHLGKIFTEEEPFQEKTRQAFELLASFTHNNQILVTTTRRLLGYLRASEELCFTTKETTSHVHIYITTIASEGDLQGLTWNIPSDKEPVLWVNDEIYTNITKNTYDENGVQSVSIPWLDLQFPNIN